MGNMTDQLVTYDARRMAPRVAGRRQLEVCPTDSATMNLDDEIVRRWQRVGASLNTDVSWSIIDGCFHD
jgi:hypothetical protein